ncbi:unnamed protein product, partial [marine sediment metagenome]
DASSGFRAFSREAALKLNIFSKHTYTHETLIQAANMGLKIIEIPVIFRKREGKSKLISGLFSHIKKSMITITSTFLKYNALKVFFTSGLISFIAGFILGLKYIYVILTGQPGSHIQSLILAAVLLII